MQGPVQASLVRVTYVAGVVQDKLRPVGQPVAFGELLMSPREVRGLELTLPFDSSTPVDTDFWTRIAERSRLKVPIPPNEVARLRRAGLPLRHAAAVAAPAWAKTAYLELLIYPFGVVALLTLDAEWNHPRSLGEVADQLSLIEGEAATFRVRGAKATRPVSQLSVAAAEAAAKVMADAGAASWIIPTFRTVTVIRGNLTEPLSSLPSPNGPLHYALHRLARGNLVLAQPSRALVSQWSGATYDWPINSLLYMLDRGAVLLSSELATNPSDVVGWTASALHRRNALLAAYISALAGLIKAADMTKPSYFREWAKTAADKLARLFGPGSDYKDWGLFPRAFLRNTGADGDVARVRGAALQPNPSFFEAPYPG
jgi:hypothetical protein